MPPHRISYFRKWLLASPPAEWALNQIRDLLIGSLQQGPVPKHVAFVMDGNRRFARSYRIETVEGHHLGFEALARVNMILEVCYKSGVTHVTIYAFSIENFKRSKYEVDALMDMAKIKLTQLAEHGDIFDRYGARIRILGQRELVKADVLEGMDRAAAMTAHNKQCVLNVCFPYTSREEITTAIRNTVEEYSRPIAQPSPEKGRRSPFQAERIANTIRSQHLTEHNKSTASSAYSPSPRSGLHSASSSSTSISSGSHDASEGTLTDTFSVSSATRNHDQFDQWSTSTASSPPSETHQLTISSHPNTSHPSKISSSSPIYPSPELITSATLTSHMFTAPDPPIDILIRTSGVERLSDFMLWQCHQATQIVFSNVLWPAFDLWSFLPIVWEWQWRVRRERSLEAEVDTDTKRSDERRSSVLT